MNKLIAFLKGNKKWNSFLWVAICLFLVITLLSLNRKENELKVTNIKINILPHTELNFLDSMAILNIITGDDSELKLQGTKLENIKMDEMELALENNPFIEEADISIDLAGNIRIKILQRSPILRVFNKKGQTYYVAKNGYKIPVNNSYTARVMIANGNIAESLTDSSFTKSKLLTDLYKIALYCSNDKFWESQIEQLYVDNYNDILLIPMIGNHSIVFGSGDNLEDKFSRLKTFYFKGLNNLGWNKYKSINLKYDNQVVAEKTEE